MAPEAVGAILGAVAAVLVVYVWVWLGRNGKK